VPTDLPVPRRVGVREWPTIRVLAVVGGAVAVVLTGRFRPGGVVVGGAVVLAVFLRLLLPRRDIGMLAVRSRGVDLVVLGGLGIAVSVLAFLVPTGS
jgi:multisubunit Na+/H+ antiporter MnhB subunit